jgi:hypothetical protein
MLQQRKPVASKTDTVTVHVGAGAPGVTVPVQVSRREMEAACHDPYLSDRETRNLAAAYARQHGNGWLASRDVWA